jgi:hypothetical protein
MSEENNTPEDDGRYADWLNDIKRLSGMDNVKNEPNPTEYKPSDSTNSQSPSAE